MLARPGDCALKKWLSRSAVPIAEEMAVPIGSLADAGPSILWPKSRPAERNCEPVLPNVCPAHDTGGVFRYAVTTSARTADSS